MTAHRDLLHTLTAHGWRRLIGRVSCCDAFDLLAALPDGCVDLIATDPPYHKVLARDVAEWDHAQNSDAEFITWIGVLCQEWRRVLKPNGSLYVFAWPGMAARVEVEIARWFNVLSHVVWYKPYSRHSQADADGLRCYFPQTERVIFAEQRGGDKTADDLVGFSEAERLLKKQIFGDYLAQEWRRAGLNYHAVTEAIGAYRTHNHGGAASNWAQGYNIPTPEQYQAMRQYLNDHHRNGSVEYLRREYEDLRREYEDLRREYEDLRRPFNVSANVPYTDVWSFPTVQHYDGKHPAEKPLALMKHIVSASSRPGAVVLDCFAGSGTTLDAARQLGRRFIGADNSEHWSQYARRRVSLPWQPALFDAPAASESRDDAPGEAGEQRELFAEERNA